MKAKTPKTQERANFSKPTNVSVINQKSQPEAKFDPKRVTAWANAVSAVLLAVKRLMEIIQLINPN